MTGCDFHPEAALDLDEIWENIAADNLNACKVGDIAACSQLGQALASVPR